MIGGLLRNNLDMNSKYFEPRICTFYHSNDVSGQASKVNTNNLIFQYFLLIFMFSNYFKYQSD